MLIFFLMYVLLCFYKMKPHRRFDPDYLSIEHTQAIKGIFIILVFFSHFNAYASYTHAWDLQYKGIVSGFRQTMVTLFLFYSGYGVVESINKKGLLYVQKLPVNRVLSTLVKFACAVLLYFLIGTCVLGQRYSVYTVLLSLVGWESLGNSNWYIFVILVLYLITYISYRFLLQKNRAVPLTLCFLLVAALVALNSVFDIKGYYWVDTALCYVAGMAWAQYRKNIEPVIHKNSIVYYAVTLLALLAAEYFKRQTGYMIVLILWNLSFAAFVVLLTMRLTLKNKLLVWCGKNLFELYILQRIPMIVFKYLGLCERNVYLYFAASAIVTLLLVWPFKYLTDKLWKLLSGGFHGH